MPPAAEIVAKPPRLGEEPAPAEPDVDDLLDGIPAVPDAPRARVVKALRDSNGRVDRAAAALGISVDRLYRLRRKYDLVPPR